MTSMTTVASTPMKAVSLSTVKEDDKMEMTQKLANDLMDCLCALAISANGRIPETEEEFEQCQQYAKDTFMTLCDQWEQVTGETWEVIPSEDIDDDVERITQLLN